jgi:methyl-accepting chemotaxis protein
VLGGELSMPLTASPDGATAPAGAATLSSRLGDLSVSTGVRGADRIDLTVRVPSADGGAVVLRAERPRPIHAEAVRVSTRLMALTGGLGLLVLAVALWTSSREVRRRVRPLRAATEQVVLTGDRSIRVPEQASGALAALSLDINRMLDSLAAQDDALAEATAEREQHARETQEQQRASARMLRERAQAAVDDTVGSVMDELREVTARAEAVRATVTAIDDRASAAAEVTRTAQSVVETGQRTADDATTNLRQVGGIIDAIATVAAQTHLLALNATIEAARAGEAGRGFAVVADEVKQLAASTATSTGQITGTLTALQHDVSALTGAIDELSSVVGGVRTQAGELLGITAEQRHTMSGLDERLQEAMQRVGELSTVTDTIERRGHERLPGTGTIALAPDGGRAPIEARVLDVSPSGARVETSGPLPVGTFVRIAVPGAGRSVAAHVVRTAPGGRGTHLGLAFDTGDGAAVTALVEHVLAGG